MANKAPEVNYESREKLDSELQSAINDILSAETEAKYILGQAGDTVKAIQLDGVTAERDMRAQTVQYAAAERDRAVAEAAKKADAECEALKAEAQKQGEEFIASKQKEIQKLADELFKSLKG